MNTRWSCILFSKPAVQAYKNGWYQLRFVCFLDLNQRFSQHTHAHKIMKRLSILFFSLCRRFSGTSRPYSRPSAALCQASERRPDLVDLKDFIDPRSALTIWAKRRFNRYKKPSPAFTTRSHFSSVLDGGAESESNDPGPSRPGSRAIRIDQSRGENYHIADTVVGISRLWSRAILPCSVWTF